MSRIPRRGAWLETNNREYLAVYLLCYACFIRPKEIALLRCRDIDLDAQTVHVRGEIAKNDNDSYRTIPDAVLPYLQRLDLSRPDWALFGKNYGDGDYEFAIHWDVRTMLEYYSGVITPTALGKLSGIHPKQLWAYQYGVSKPRKAQVAKIEAALHRLGHELANTSF